MSTTDPGMGAPNQDAQGPLLTFGPKFLERNIPWIEVFPPPPTNGDRERLFAIRFHRGNWELVQENHTFSRASFCLVGWALKAATQIYPRG